MTEERVKRWMIAFALIMLALSSISSAQQAGSGSIAMRNGDRFLNLTKNGNSIFKADSLKRFFKIEGGDDELVRVMSRKFSSMMQRNRRGLRATMDTFDDESLQAVWKNVKKKAKLGEILDEITPWLSALSLEEILEMGPEKYKKLYAMKRDPKFLNVYEIDPNKLDGLLNIGSTAPLEKLPGGAIQIEIPPGKHIDPEWRVNKERNIPFV